MTKDWVCPFHLVAVYEPNSGLMCPYCYADPYTPPSNSAAVRTRWMKGRTHA